MGIFSYFRTGRKQTISNASQQTEGLPTNGGRSSASEAEQNSHENILSLINGADTNKYKEYIKAIRHLCKHNNDFGLAIDNIASLGNTPFSIEFDKGVSDDQSKEMIADINACSKEWYSYSEGLNSMIGDLLCQVLISGAISAEAVPTNNLDGIKKSVMVDPEYIVFKYDKVQDVYKPYQQIQGVAMGNPLNLIELNTVTYKYLASRRFSEDPIGIPPLLTALESTIIEKDMICNLKHVTKKLGALGFLEIMVNAPAKKASENDAAYQKRLEGYLSNVAPQVEKGLSNGYMIGFRDSFEVDMKNISGNVQGARELFNLTSEMKMAGLKQDPLMLGRNFNTTETLGRVLLAKLVQKLSSYQGLVASYLEDLFRLHLLLRGFKFETVTVTFESAMLSDKLKDEEARAKKIENEDNLYKQGVTSQQDRAEALGYDEPDEEEPREASNFDDTAAPGTSTKKEVTEVDE